MHLSSNIYDPCPPEGRSRINKCNMKLKPRRSLQPILKPNLWVLLALQQILSGTKSKQQKVSQDRMRFLPSFRSNLFKRRFGVSRLCSSFTLLFHKSFICSDHLCGLPSSTSTSMSHTASIPPYLTAQLIRWTPPRWRNGSEPKS